MSRTVTWVGHTSSLKCRGLFFFGQLVWNIPVTVCDLLWCRWIRLIEIFSTVLAVSSSELRCASGFFYIFFLPFSLPPLFINYKRRERKNKEIKKDPRGTPKFWQWDNQYCWKDLNEMNPTTSRKVTNGDRSVLHKLFEDKWALAYLDDPCGPLQSLFITFFNVVGFVSLKSFQQYQWYRFSVSSRSFYFFLSLFFSLASHLFLYCKMY
jgi:hypothetical protein